MYLQSIGMDFQKKYYLTSYPIHQNLLDTSRNLQNFTMSDEVVVKDNVASLAEWLRGKHSHLETSDGVLVEAGKRVELFYGKHLLKVLENANMKKFPEIKEFSDASTEEFIKHFNEMLGRAYFQRVSPMEIKKKRFDAEHATRVQRVPEQTFDGEGMYMWIMEPNQQWALAKALGIIVAVITICCFKIWPIWLRICSWWACLLVLGTLIYMYLCVPPMPPLTLPAPSLAHHHDHPPRRIRTALLPHRHARCLLHAEPLRRGHLLHRHLLPALRPRRRAPGQVARGARTPDPHQGGQARGQGQLRGGDARDVLRRGERVALVEDGRRQRYRLRHRRIRSRILHGPLLARERPRVRHLAQGDAPDLPVPRTARGGKGGDR